VKTREKGKFYSPIFNRRSDISFVMSDVIRPNISRSREVRYATIVTITEGSHDISFVLFVSQTTPPLSVMQRAVYPKI